MVDIFKHGCTYYKFICGNCGCEFGTNKVSIAVNRETRLFSHASTECPECCAWCICNEEKEPPKRSDAK